MLSSERFVGAVAPRQNGHGANAFDFIRIAAAFAVLHSHSFALLGITQPSVFTFGDTAISAFFVVSGYLVCQSWDRDPDLLHFALRRALRILPGLFVAVTVTTFVIGALATSHTLQDYFASGLTWTYLVSNLSLICDVDSLPGVFEKNPYAGAINGSLWSLRYEVLMYVVLASLGFLAKRWGLRLICGAVFICFIALWCWGTVAGYTRYPLPLPLLWRVGLEFDGIRFANLGVFFFSGSLLYLYRAAIPMSPFSAAALLAVAVASAGTAWSNAVLWIALPYAVIVAAHCLPAPFRVFGKADYSYGIHIYAFPIQQLLSQANWTW